MFLKEVTMKAIYPVVFTDLTGGGVMIQALDIPTCITSGKDRLDAMHQIREALEGCWLVLEDEGAALPTPSDIETIDAPSNGFVSLIDVDTERARRENDERAVRKNVSMPSWMADRVDRLGLNLSQFLQDALKDKFAWNTR
jgi:predicted RNase H-like HicB family nuclease